MKSLEQDYYKYKHTHQRFIAVLARLRILPRYKNNLQARYDYVLTDHCRERMT